jgi:2-pyrone-4,6-dicarboxylate lactonase
MTATIPPPHANAHAPRLFTPPAKACDAHCHIFGPGDRFPYSDDRSYTPPDSGLEDFERLQGRLGLSRAVFVQASCHGVDNSAMVDAIVRGNGKYAGVAMIDESFTDADIAALDEVGVRGTRFNLVAPPSYPSTGGWWNALPSSGGTSCCTSMPKTSRRMQAY